MDNKIFILLVLLIIGAFLVHGLSVMDNNNESFDTILNDSNVGQVDSVSGVAKLNESKTEVEAVSGIISKEDYYKAFKKMLDDSNTPMFENANVTVNGPYKMNNGTYYYSVVVRYSFDGAIETLYVDMDAKVQPKILDAQGLAIAGALSEYYTEHYDVQKSQLVPKVSEKQIMENATKTYKRFNEKAPWYVDLFSTADNQVVYVVDWGNMVYDASTGKIVSSFLDVPLSDFPSEPKCRQLAENSLNKMGISGAYLGKTIVEPEMGGFYYDYEVFVDVNGQSTKLGHISVSPFTMEVTLANVNQNYQNTDVNVGNNTTVESFDINEYSTNDDEYNATESENATI